MKVASYLLPDDGSSLIVGFDLTISESHEATAEVTEHPVEEGSKIADHVHLNPRTLSLEVYVTNTPSNDLGGRGVRESLELQYPRYSPPLAPTPGSLFRAAKNAVGGLVDLLSGGQPPAKVTVLLFPEEFDRVQETHATLTDLWERKVTMTVVTSTKNYDSMVLTRVSLPRDHGGGASFNLDLKHITTVTTATVKAPQPAEKRGAPGQNKGSQAGKPVSGKDAPKASSLALKGLQAIGLVE